MKKLVLVMVCMLVLVGCVGSGSVAVLEPSPTPTLTATPVGVAPAASFASVTPSGEPPVDRTWISPGKVMISNFYPGARAEYPITIHNGELEDRVFSVTYRDPNHVAEGYVKAPAVVQDWVMVVDPTPVLGPRETRDILVVVEMPSDAEVFAEKWEFWVSIRDASQTGMVQTELSARWLVKMKGAL